MNEEKNALYQLIMRQLEKDGYWRAAENLSDTALLPREGGAQREVGADEVDLEAIVHHHMLTHAATARSLPTGTNLGQLGPSTLDFASADRVSKWTSSTAATVALSGANAVGCFDWNGSVFAGGSADGAVRIIDATLAFRGAPGDETQPLVLKTLLDHTEAVTSLAFHPRARVLFSASKDKTIRFFGYTGMATRSFAHITDTHPVRSISLHPSGDFILAGSAHPLPRIYQTEQPGAPALVALDPGHSGPVTHVHWAKTAQTYVSASRDGSVKLWDAVSCRVIRTFAGCHGGAVVGGAVISRSGHYLLSSGGDGTARTFDLRMGAALRVYKGLSTGPRGGAGASSKTLAVFAGGNEEYVVGGGEQNDVLIWDTLQGGNALQRQVVGPNDSVLSCVTHPGSTVMAIAACTSLGKVIFLA